MGQKAPTLDGLIARSPDPEATALRYEQLQSDADLRDRTEALPPEGLADLIAVIGISGFLFQYLCSHGSFIDDFRYSPAQDIAREPVSDFTGLRHHKYRELLRLTRLDLSCTDEDLLRRTHGTDDPGRTGA
ncbi:MAG: hypothetical protein U5P41_08535 [Gammaproteobacteria bacterium]|nr:hypothetical protein [Gammaproteobacteria bacterium]